MRHTSTAFILFVSALVGSALPAPASAQVTSDLGGQWTLNRELSQFPRELGFNADFLAVAGAGVDSTTGGGRGGRGGGTRTPAPNRVAPRESQEDAERNQRLTGEVRNPSTRLTIVDTPTAVTITDDQGQSRTIHPDGKEVELQIGGVPVGVTATREAGRLVVLYNVEQGRQLRYTLARVSSPTQLIVDVEFIERGGGDKVRRIYEPASATDTRALAAAPSPAATRPGTGVPASGASATQTINQQPDAPLKGLTRLGVVVEDLTPQAASCGLNQDAIETAVSKRLSDAGFKVVRYSDDDTYFYVNIITTSPSAGLCVSRYDVYVHTNTAAKLSYQETLVLVQVTLLHKGGIAGGAPGAHADSVLRGIQEYVDQFTARIHNANK